MTPATLFYARNRPGAEVDYNHLEEGHHAAPLLKHVHAAEWLPVFAWLTDDVPPKVVHYSPEEAEPA